MAKEVSPELAEFLFDIVKRVKQSYEIPVIFFTKKDYSDNIFNKLCEVRALYLEGNDQTLDFKKKAMDRIVDYHLQWLQAVNEIEQFKKRLTDNSVDKNEVCDAITFTINAMKNRLKYFIRYMDKHKVNLNNRDHINVNADIEIVEEMHTEVVAALEEKLKCYNAYDCYDTFKQKVILGIEELLLYYDKLNDNLSIDLIKHFNLNVPELPQDLTKSLQQIVNEFHTSDTEASQKLFNDLRDRGTEIGTMIRSTAPRNLEIKKIVDKINVLEDRIYRMRHEESSAAVLALQNKKEFLEMRLASLENMKTSIKQLNEAADLQYDDVPETEICECQDFFQLRIFNHSLPLQERERLVTKLCYLWDLAVFGETKHKSLISILSVTETREEFTDDLGMYYIDENNRKIYKVPGDDTLYQVNDLNELVPLADDSEHIYFYDECGRYFIDPCTREKVYKAHATASEYVMDSSGVLLKIKEERDGKTFYYDNFGRYYINANGTHIYQDEDGGSEYEHDGLGNLVRIRSFADLFEPCPEDVRVSEDFKYLKYAVGAPLRHCISKVILHQPADPIKYLGQCLMKYRENMQLRDNLAAERAELEIERERIRSEERAAAERAAMEALRAQGGSEASYDSNLVNYEGMKDTDNETSSPSNTANQ